MKNGELGELEETNMKNIANTKSYKKISSYVLVFFIIALTFSLPLKSSALTANLNVTNAGAASFDVGEKDATVSFRIKNNEPNDVRIDSASLSFLRQGFTVSGGIGGSTTIGKGQETIITFSVTVSNTYNYPNAVGTLELKSGVDVVYSKAFTYDVFSNVEASPGTGGNYIVAVQISHSLDNPEGILAEKDNNLSIGVFNRGNTTIKNANVEVVLPEGLYINNGSTTSNVGTLAIGNRATANFPVSADADIDSKNYSVEVIVTGNDYNNEAVKVSKTIYVPVKSGKSKGSIEDMEISNVSIPDEVLTETDFRMSFEVKNKGSKELKNVKISCEMPTGLYNKTRSTFVESLFAPGDSKYYSVNLYSEVDENTSFPIKITVESVDAKDGGTVTQYANVFVKKDKVKTDAKTPQLMVSAYSYGGSYVQAGAKFRLNLTLQNTSGRDLSNIKVTLGSDGTFIPVNSSNSFFIESVGKKQQTNYSVMLSVKPDAKQETSAMDISMSYEDGDKEFTSKDTISIPVMQESRLAVDEIMQPMELFMGNPAGLSVQFYNMGKTTLNNLRVTAYGDFDTMESISYFVGNMDPGKSDTYDFALIPRQEGLMTGAVVFTYEDAGGEEQTYEMPFEFQVMGEMPIFGPEPDMPLENEKKGISKWIWIVGGVAVIGVGAGVFIRKKRRKKKQMELEIDE